MKNHFKKIGLFAKHNNRSIADTFEKLIIFLQKKGIQLAIEKESVNLLPSAFTSTLTLYDREEMGKHSDLIIVVGGDGSLLNAARAVVAYQIPVLGINRGRLGFLADILPDEMEKELNEILEGRYNTEQRFLLEASIQRPSQALIHSTALNDVVLYSGSLARMVDFEVYINDQFMLRQQADGIITATPTGSTAYALSAGGPILYPTLNAITLTPLCPHTLSSRPIVVDNNSHLKLVVTEDNATTPKLSCDGQSHFDLPPGSEVSIQRYKHELHLIHPLHHHYFSVLREKLGWST